MVVSKRAVLRPAVGLCNTERNADQPGGWRPGPPIDGGSLSEHSAEAGIERSDTSQPDVEASAPSRALYPALEAGVMWHSRRRAPPVFGDTAGASDMVAAMIAGRRVNAGCATASCYPLA